MKLFIFSNRIANFNNMYLTSILLSILLFIIGACNPLNDNHDYHKGEPVILKKEYSLIPGVCKFTYEGYGRKETFEDKCDKYSVGDKLGGNINELDTLKIK